jgi:hypothetical protein
LPHKIEVKPLSAADKKVLSTTNERKVMSKSTFFKRIALTAIAALGFGMLSVAPSQAAVTSHTLTIDAATETVDRGLTDSATAVLTHSFVNLGSAVDSVVISAVVTSSNAANAGVLTFAISDSYTSTSNLADAANSPVYSHGQSMAKGADAAAGTANAVAAASGIFANSDGYGTTRDSITIAPYGSTTRAQGTVLTLRMYDVQAAGTYAVSIFTQVSNGGAALASSTVGATWTVTFTDPSKKATSDSTATLRQGNATDAATWWGGTAEGSDSQTLAAATATTTDITPEFTVVVNQKNGTATNTAQESFTVSVTGEAWVTTAAQTTAMATRLTATSATAQKALTFAYPAAETPVEVHLWSTGTAGTATVTLATVGGVALGSKTLTFHGDVAKLEVTTMYKKVLRAGISTSQTDVMLVKATDAAGYAVTGAGPLTITSSDVTQITTGTCSDTVSSGTTATFVTDGSYLCSVTGLVGSASGKAVTLTIEDADETVEVTSAHTMGGAVSTVTLTTDKASYEPGEIMAVIATAKDSSGNAPADQIAGPSLSFNKSAGAAISMSTYIAGVSVSHTRSAAGTVTNTQNLFAPAASGKFRVSGLDGQTTPAVIFVEATVGDDAATTAANAASDAAAEAIDAANAATDAANLAAEAADAATVAAEEARDAADAATAAVEALATEVATLMAALKAQITTLANTVAKIAKKVKA